MLRLLIGPLLIGPLLVMSFLGCGKAEQALQANSAANAVTATDSQATAPRDPRNLDAAAEKELKELANASPESGESALEPYEGVRWRFNAEVMNLYASEPMGLNPYTAIVAPEGTSRVYVRMRSLETKTHLYPGQKHEFEGTFEKYINQYGIDALVFSDVIVIGAQPHNPQIPKSP
jgi:hypothetical protein